MVWCRVPQFKSSTQPNSAKLTWRVPSLPKLINSRDLLDHLSKFLNYGFALGEVLLTMSCIHLLWGLFLMTNPMWLAKKPLLGHKNIRWFPTNVGVEKQTPNSLKLKGKGHCTLSRGELILLSYERKEHLERTWHACVSSWLVHWTDNHWCDFLQIRIAQRS